ncbi:MAG: Fe-S cluster assembly ATPase SufC [Ignavibacteriales bacterium]|nr:Fe-S cluster assembly ATPase SufC [Ignavibacteriales bacterium]MCF8316481.1 Fe-S cluster assembly ATPase SufC [Ignavibacteriales bacterium]MCF8437961.1 Fe-S cluster assembly ATPase SufC [Ignavibacteriales bacterium]
MLKIVNLHAEVEGKPILKGINLEINKGEVHAIMGPNGSGKSTLANVLSGNENYQVTEGEIWYEGHNMLDLSPEDRAREGVFLAFQYPVEIPGISNATLLKTAINEIRKHNGMDDISPKDFLAKMREKGQILGMNDLLINRSVNSGFSGGEKKRNEILQLLMLEPKLALLDETDSGLDIDALKIVSTGVNSFRSSENAVLLVTHYQRLLNYIVPDFVHVLSNGKILKSGGKELALKLEDQGYDWINKAELETESV